MKKRIVLLTCAALCLLLAGCASNEVQVDTGSDAVADPTAEVAQVPTPAPGRDQGDIDDTVVDITAPPNSDVAAYDYVSLTEGSFTMMYPSHWERVPGVNTICFVEPVSDDTIPARITLTKKTISKSVDNKVKLEQFSAYFETILAGFDSHEVSKLDKEQEFLGDKEAYAATYTARKGEKLYKGFAIMANKGKTFCVYHFRCAETDYDRMASVRERIKSSIGTVKNE